MGKMFGYCYLLIFPASNTPNFHPYTTSIPTPIAILRPVAILTQSATFRRKIKARYHLRNS